MNILKTMLGAAIALAIVAAIPSYSHAKDCPDDPVRITHIIWTESSNAAWAPMIRGVEEAAEYTCADVDIQYGDADPEKQNSIMQTAIANEVDAVTGLALCFGRVHRQHPPDDRGRDPLHQQQHQ